MAETVEEYACKLQIALTGLAGGGSENFVRHGDEFRADILACVAKVQQRLNAANERWKAAHRRAAEADAEIVRLAAIAESALFHYWCCGEDDGCGKLRPSMASLAVATGFDRVSVMGDEIRSATTKSAPPPAVVSDKGDRE